MHLKHILSTKPTGNYERTLFLEPGGPSTDDDPHAPAGAATRNHPGSARGVAELSLSLQG